MLVIAPDQEALNMDIFSIFFNMKVYCVFSLESPRFQCVHTIYHFYNKKENHPRLF